jgi:shikimate dehydrogenase
MGFRGFNLSMPHKVSVIPHLDGLGESASIMGAARAIAVELGLAGVKKIMVVNRSEERGRGLAGLLRDKLQLDCELVCWQGNYTVPEGVEIVINGTSIGLYDGEAKLALNLDSLKPGTVVADVVFSPPQTRLLRDAAARGCQVLDGLGMLVNQGVIGVKYWTGVDPDAGVMRRTLGEILGS